MSSLFTDTIRKTGGSLGVDIRVKNTSVYESDGGTSVTQNLVQGLAKFWVHMHYSGGTPTTQDSLNNSSNTDTGTGDVNFNFTNNMASASYTAAGANQTSRARRGFFAGTTTSNINSQPTNSSDANVDDDICCLAVGDLA
jgi:hypothetical protein